MDDLKDAIVEIIDPGFVRATVGHLIAIGKADAILALFAARGLAVVPVEPTPEMLKAGMDFRYDSAFPETAGIYAAMIEAAP